MPIVGNARRTAGEQSFALVLQRLHYRRGPGLSKSLSTHHSRGASCTSQAHHSDRALGRFHADERRRLEPRGATDARVPIGGSYSGSPLLRSKPHSQPGSYSAKTIQIIAH